ncbi:hypothetical protein PAHAL_1G277000 [Panicum hallii]|uniref:RING-type E3 ubiquitin transferase n=1 Tax=Panicum hallii TaxID=206008 RepID=A0A2S3GQQ1_9POAL|nr:E3 ubiquitin-protein ligase Os04g0590900-like [Panicum hallii]PAN06624.1 hypothetical protein PAHAL_1G277000 [Panicum hallii]
MAENPPLPLNPCDGPDPKHKCSPPVLAPPSLYLYPPPPPSSSAASRGKGTFVTALIIAGSVLSFLALCLSIFLFVRRMRRRRRQQEALLEAALAPAAPPTAPPDDGAGLNPTDEEVVHHAWHIRTVGLDEAAIESIALTRYRAGGALGASDCTVCLGEFQDGELLRLLPKCVHAFHVQCIDTWLRAHVNCPLCRANVTGPAAEQPDPTPPGAGADAEQEEQDAGNIGAPEQEQPGQHAGEQRAQVDQRDQPDISSEHPRQRPGPRGRSFRRVASMDSPSPVASPEEAPEHDQAGGEKQGTGGAAAVCCEVSPGSDRLNRAAMKRSLSAGSRWTLLSRHCRARSSLLPL